MYSIKQDSLYSPVSTGGIVVLLLVGKDGLTIAEGATNARRWLAVIPVMYK